VWDEMGYLRQENKRIQKKLKSNAFYSRS
jgi:hypothetical protein